MHTNIFRQRARLQVMVLGVLSVLTSFAVGIRTAGDVRTIGSLQAGTALGSGDVNGDAVIDLADVVVILEIVRGYRSEDPQALRADPNGDGSITVDDALQLLNTLAL